MPDTPVDPVDLSSFTPYRFVLRAILKSPEGVLARSTTLRAVLPSRYRYARDELGADRKLLCVYQDLYDAVSALRRSRLIELGLLGVPFCALGRFTVAVNCPPTGGRFEEVGGRLAMCCERRFVCPWCWARRVAVPFLGDLSAALDRNGMSWCEGLPVEKYPYTLVRYYRYRYVSVDAAVDALDMAAALLEGEWLRLKAAGCPGAALTAVVGPRVPKRGAEPRDPQLPPEYIITYGWVALWPRRRAGLDAVLGERAARTPGGVASFPSWHRHRLAYIAQPLVTFPAGMLLGPVAPALDLFNERKRVRLIRWKGSMVATGCLGSSSSVGGGASTFD